MPTSPLIIRPPLSSDELTEHMQGYVEVAQSFSPDPLPEDTAQRLLDRLTTLPGYRQEQVHSAYRDGKQVGGYRIYERLLRVGTARLVTGCIGGVYTRAEARNQGVATALMHDALVYAQAHDYALLLLDGIPKFYHRFGYCDVFDSSVLELDRQAILALAQSPYKVRPATADDAASVMALYERQFGPYTGSFQRSIEQHTHWIQHLAPEKLWLAIDSANPVRGYLFSAATQARGAFFLAGTQLWELAVDDWPAAIALLQHHVRQAKGQDGQATEETFLCSVPPTSPVAQWVAEHLEVVDISTWDNPILGWAVREQTFRHRNAGWMARLVSLPALTRAMLPEWQARWQRSLAHWSGDISLLVDDEAFTLRISGIQLELLDAPGSRGNVFSLTPQAFTQVVFGYSPIVRVLEQQGRSLPGDLTSVLTILFPTGQTWIPASDWF